MPLKELKLFAGTSHPELAAAIAKELGVKLSEADIHRFACNEIYAKPTDTVRGADVFIVQTCTSNVNEDLMELFVMIDSMKRSFAHSIHVVMPHFGYARQDRVSSSREPITAKLIADLFGAAGATHMIGVEFHSAQAQGFFNFPVDNLHTRGLFYEYFASKKLKDLVIVSPDAGGAKEAKTFADCLGAELAVLNKHRSGKNQSEVLSIVGDVEGKTCVIFDDLVDTGGSVVNAKEALEKEGANKDIYLAATHGVLSGPAVERLDKAGFAEVVLTDTIPFDESRKFKGLKVLSVAPLLASVIENVHSGKSVSGLWDIN